MSIKLNTQIRNCFNINTIKNEMDRIRDNKELKLRRIEDTLHNYYNRVNNMIECKEKTQMINKLNQMKTKLYNTIRQMKQREREIAFKNNNKNNNF